MNQSMIYREVLSRGCSTFELCEDHVIVRLRYPSYSSELTVLLSDLRPNTNKIYLREWPFNVGLALLIIPVAIFAIWMIVGKVVPSIETTSFFGSTMVVGAVICFYCLRKIEFTSFVNQQGLTALDVGDAGPDRAEYHSFVNLLASRIASIHSQT